MSFGNQSKTLGNQTYMADLAEEEGGWLSAEQMLSEIQQNEETLYEQSSTGVKTVQFPHL